MPLAAFILALCSLVVALLALAWNIASWLMSIGRGRAYLWHGYDLSGVHRAKEMVDRRGRGMIYEGPRGVEVLGVEVHNIGRAALIIERYDIVFEPSGSALQLEYREIPGFGRPGPPLPHTIEPGNAAFWWAPVETLQALAAPLDGRSAHLRVTTAHRKVIRTKRSFILLGPQPLPDGEPLLS